MISKDTSSLIEEEMKDIFELDIRISNNIAEEDDIFTILLTLIPEGVTGSAVCSGANC